MEQAAMTIDTELLRAQMDNVRIVDGRFERRVVGDEWEPWPVLALDRLGQDEVKRVLARPTRRRE